MLGAMYNLIRRHPLVLLVCLCIFSRQVFAQNLPHEILNTTNIANSPSEVENLLPREKGTQSSDPNSSDKNGFQEKINIHILGDVESPGVFKVPMYDTVSEVIKLARPNRKSLRVVQIRRQGEKTQYLDLYGYYYFGNLKQNPHIQEGDTVFVPSASGTVRIHGPVRRTGYFELFGEKNLYQVVSLAGGFTKANAKDFPIKAIRFEDNGEKQILSVMQDDKSLKQFEIKSGDVYIVPDLINAKSKFDYTIETIPGEKTVYATSLPQVFVVGAVQKTGPYPYKSHLTIKDYIGLSGALTATKWRSVKVLREGKYKRVKIDSHPQSGDIIMVRENEYNKIIGYMGVASTALSVVLTAFILSKQ